VGPSARAPPTPPQPRKSRTDNGLTRRHRRLRARRAGIAQSGDIEGQSWGPCRQIGITTTKRTDMYQQLARCDRIGDRDHRGCSKPAGQPPRCRWRWVSNQLPASLAACRAISEEAKPLPKPRRIANSPRQTSLASALRLRSRAGSSSSTMNRLGHGPTAVRQRLAQALHRT
jgi:hypothetical protein